MRKALVLLGVGVVVLVVLVLSGGNGARLGARVVGSRWRDIPLVNAGQRPQLLRFGMFVTPDPEQNPIDPPERFTGYHAALDLEMLEGEEGREVVVRAVCAGPVVRSELAQGYGGVLVQECEMEGQVVTVLYGHLQLDSLAAVGEELSEGEGLGVLAAANTEDSGYTRKHLHLGIHKGAEVDMRGYVQREEELGSFLDPKEVLGL